MCRTNPWASSWGCKKQSEHDAAHALTRKLGWKQVRWRAQAQVSERAEAMQWSQLVQHPKPCRPSATNQPHSLSIPWEVLLKKKASGHQLSFAGTPGSTMEEEMVTHSSILAWKIPWTEGPGGLRSIPSTQSPTWLECVCMQAPHELSLHCFATALCFSPLCPLHGEKRSTRWKGRLHSWETQGSDQKQRTLPSQQSIPDAQNRARSLRFPSSNMAASMGQVKNVEVPPNCPGVHGHSFGYNHIRVFWFFLFFQLLILRLLCLTFIARICSPPETPWTAVTGWLLYWKA